jgi:hypothetical protein
LCGHDSFDFLHSRDTWLLLCSLLFLAKAHLTHQHQKQNNRSFAEIFQIRMYHYQDLF